MNTIRIVFWSASIGIVSGTMAMAAPPTPRSQPQVEYSADSYMETEQLTMKSKVYRAPGKERKEQTMGGENMVTIMRTDKQLIWTLMPGEMYMEMSLQGGQQPQGTGDDPSTYTYERTEVGPETIDGHQTTKYKVIATNPKGEKMGGFMWVMSNGIQMKMDLIGKTGNTKSRMKTGLTNLTIGRQDPKLFEIPEGYTKMVMPDFGGRGGPAGATGTIPTRPNSQMPSRPNLPDQEEVTDQAATESEEASDAVKKGVQEEGINRFKGLFGR